MDRHQATSLVHQLEILSLGVEESLARSVAAGKALYHHYVGGGSRKDAASIQRRIEVETHHLLVDVAGIWKIAIAVNRATGDHRIAKAVKEFENGAQAARDFRDFYEHADDYILETEKRHSDALRPRDVEIALGSGGEIDYVVHGKPSRRASVGGAASAVLTLSGTTADVLRY
jgi:hypothetical protein